MQVVQAFRFELDPNRVARVALAKHVGAARFAYNWGLARYYPSTRLCSNCGCLAPKLPLSQRTFWCPECGHVEDRDLNAALNLRIYGLAAISGPTGSSLGSNACGDLSGGGTTFGSVYEPRVEEAGSGRSSERHGTATPISWPPFEVK